MLTAELGFNAVTLELFDYRFTKMTFSLSREDGLKYICSADPRMPEKLKHEMLVVRARYWTSMLFHFLNEVCGIVYCLFKSCYQIFPDLSHTFASCTLFYFHIACGKTTLLHSRVFVHWNKKETKNSNDNQPCLWFNHKLFMFAMQEVYCRSGQWWKKCFHK